MFLSPFLNKFILPYSTNLYCITHRIFTSMIKKFYALSSTFLRRVLSSVPFSSRSMNLYFLTQQIYTILLSEFTLHAQRFLSIILCALQKRTELCAFLPFLNEFTLPYSMNLYYITQRIYTSSLNDFMHTPLQFLCLINSLHVEEPRRNSPSCLCNFVHKNRPVH